MSLPSDHLVQERSSWDGSLLGKRQGHAKDVRHARGRDVLPVVRQQGHARRTRPLRCRADQNVGMLLGLPEGQTLRLRTLADVSEEETACVVALRSKRHLACASAHCDVSCLAFLDLDLRSRLRNAWTGSCKINASSTASPMPHPAQTCVLNRTKRNLCLGGSTCVPARTQSTRTTLRPWAPGCSRKRPSVLWDSLGCVEGRAFPVAVCFLIRQDISCYRTSQICSRCN